MSSPRWALALVLLAACADKPATGPGPAVPSAPRLPAMRWLPPGNDIVYAYKTENLIDRTTGVLTLRLRNPTEDSVELVIGDKTELLRYQPSGILRERLGTLLLRTPPEPGVRWPAGPNASARVGRVELPFTCEAGSFKGCLEVIEERQAPVPGTITTTFCPDVGIVRIETVADEPPVHERVELRSFGKAVDLSKP